MSATQIKDDAFIGGLLAKLPIAISATFTDDQLHALKQALDAPKRVHAIDLRWTLSFWRGNYYFVFLLGRDRRELSRRAQALERVVLAAALGLFVTVSVLFGLLVLYLIKSALGIDIFPHYSLGIWDWFRMHFL